VILCDKTLCEGFYSFSRLDAVIPRIDLPTKASPGPGYSRYLFSENGVSPLLFPPSPGTVIKVNGYTHDQAGITTENSEIAALMSEKRQKKGAALASEVSSLNPVVVGGDTGSDMALICWGSPIGVCREVAGSMGLRVVQPVVLSPFPKLVLQDALQGTERQIVVEENAEGQLAMLLARHGIRPHSHIRRYDGRPFAVEELEARIREALA